MNLETKTEIAKISGSDLRGNDALNSVFARNSKPIFLELFRGSGNMTKAFKAAGYAAFSIDLYETADLQADIRHLSPKHIIELCGGRPTVIWASPPCQAFSIAACSRNFTDRVPSSDKAFLGVELLAHTLRLIMALQPKKWYIENPRGMMRTLPIMQNLHKRTFTFCQYGDNAQKPTDIWTNNHLFTPLACKAGDPCHDAQPRGYKHKVLSGAIGKGTQGKSNAKERGTLPTAFCDYVASL